jgi:large repetitive protein
MHFRKTVLAATLAAAALTAIAFVSIELFARDSSGPATAPVESVSHAPSETGRASRTSPPHRALPFHSGARGSVRGRLVDSHDGSAVAGIAVRLGDGAAVATASQGEFRFDGVASGTYALSLDDDVWRIASPPMRAQVPDGGGSDFGDVAVCAGAKLFGRVVDDDGRPIARAEVRAIAAGGDSTASTDDDGRFVLRAVAIDRPVEVVATHPDHAPGRTERVVAPAKSETSVGDVRLVSGSTICGVVTDALGRPIAGASVRARDEDLPATQPPITDRAVETAADGSYRAAHLLAGRYAIVASAPGFASASRGGVVVSRSDGEIVSGADLKLPSGWSISGRVVDPSSKPIAGARVIADPQEGAEFAGAPGESPSTPSGPDGSFTIDELPATTYRISAIASGRFQKHFDVVDAGRTDVRIVLCEGASIAGVAKRADADAPVAGARVVAHSTAGNTIPYDAVADAHGEFAIVGLPEGPYVVTASADDFAPASSESVYVREGKTASGIVLRLPAGSRISGVVRDATDRSPIAGAIVSLESDSPAADVAGPLEARSGADGAFTIHSPPAGKFVLAASHRDFVSARTSPIDLEAGAMLDGADVLLPRGGSVRGVVLADDGLPAAGDDVAAIPIDGAVKTQCTDAEGCYEIRGLAPGPCSIVRRRDARAGAEEETRTVEVRDGDVVEVDFGRRELRCVVRGAVRAGADALSFATVSFTSEGEEDSKSRSAMTDSEGAWEIPGLVPGAYRVSLGGKSGAASLDCTWTVDVPAAPEWRLDLLVPRGRVAGRVTDAGSGAPVAGVFVVASRSDGGSPARASSDSNGAYELAGLPSGEYTVTATPPDASLVCGRVLEVRVAEGEKTTLDLVLAAAGTLEGTLVDLHGESIAGPISGRVFDENAVEVPNSRFVESASSTFHLPGLPAGTFTLEVSAPGYAVSRRSVRIEAGAIRREEITMSAGGSIRVLVTDDAGGAIEGAAIHLAGVEAPSHGEPNTFVHLAAGEYTVLARLDDGRQGTARVAVEEDRESVARVTIR